MKPKHNSSGRNSHSDISFSYRCNTDTRSMSVGVEHILVFVYSGILNVSNGKRKYSVRKGEYIFLCGNRNTSIINQASDGTPFRAVFMGFNRNFLHEFYFSNIDKTTIPSDVQMPETTIVELPKSPQLDSIYISMLCYIKRDILPVIPIIRLKLKEAVYCLLQTDKRFYPCLFNFIKPSEDNPDIAKGYIDNIWFQSGEIN